MTGQKQLREQAWQAYRAGTLFTGEITITKEGQVLSKLNPQAGARAEEPGSQR